MCKGPVGGQLLATVKNSKDCVIGGQKRGRQEADCVRPQMPPQESGVLSQE